MRVTRLFLFFLRLTGLLYHSNLCTHMNTHRHRESTQEAISFSTFQFWFFHIDLLLFLSTFLTPRELSWVPSQSYIFRFMICIRQGRLCFYPFNSPLSVNMNISISKTFDGISVKFGESLCHEVKHNSLKFGVNLLGFLPLDETCDYEWLWIFSSSEGAFQERKSF